MQLFGVIRRCLVQWWHDLVGNQTQLFETSPRAPRANSKSGRAFSKPNHSCRSTPSTAHSLGKLQPQRAGATTKFKRCYQSSQQYSIIALTDESGNVTERYAYDAYGVPTIFDAAGVERATSTENNRFMYTGQEWDEDLALYYFGARMYDPYSGRFCSRDPIGYVDGQNLYRAYLGLSGTDPTGEKMVKTGIQLCNDGGPFGHSYVKTKGGIGYGYYAQCHLEAPSVCGDLKTVLVTPGIVKDFDHDAYPDAACKDMYVNDECIDPECYEKTIDSLMSWWELNPGLYNVFMRNCHTWSRDLVYGSVPNGAIWSNCSRNGKGCGGKVIFIESDPLRPKK